MLSSIATKALPKVLPNAKKAPGQLRPRAGKLLILYIKSLVGTAGFEPATPTPPVKKIGMFKSIL